MEEEHWDRRTQERLRIRERSGRERSHGDGSSAEQSRSLGRLVDPEMESMNKNSGIGCYGLVAMGSTRVSLRSRSSYTINI